MEENYVEGGLANALIAAGGATLEDTKMGMNYTLNKSLNSFTK
ncbi:hypothetical protein [Veillonella montpellierensis]|nr:hypothetical protein [Veillonella montpellierensis]